MKGLEQLIVRGRGLARSARAVLPGPAARQRPVRLVLRLNDLRMAPGLLRATGEPMGLGAWQDAIVKTTRWLGPLRVTIAGGEPALSPLLPDLVRFANRLECPVHLVTAGPVSGALAHELVDRGLAAVTVLVGGLDEGTHRAVVGASLDHAVGAVEQFCKARAERVRPLGVYVALPIAAANVGSFGSIASWARQSGADGVLASLPLGCDPPPGAAEAIAALGRDDLTPAHLPSWIQGRRSRLHAGLRAEILADGTLAVSPCVAPLGQLREASPQELWERSDEQIQAARAHPRPWDEVELVPEDLRSRR